jgi:hypothetical protein
MAQVVLERNLDTIEEENTRRRIQRWAQAVEEGRLAAQPQPNNHSRGGWDFLAGFYVGAIAVTLVFLLAWGMR